MGLEQELAQQAFGLGGGGTMQVQLVLDRVVALAQALQGAVGQAVAAVAQYIAAFQRQRRLQQACKFAACLRFILFGHARAWLGPWALLGRNRRRLFAHRGNRTDCCTEQGRRILVIFGKHRNSLPQDADQASTSAVGPLSWGGNRGTPCAY